MKKKIRLTENQLRNVVKESVNRIINEVRFGGDSFHGNRQEDWFTLGELRDDLGDRLYHDDYPKMRQFLKKGTKDHHNAESIVNKRHQENPHILTLDDEGFYNNNVYLANWRNNRIKKNLGIKESYLHNVVKESVNRLLKEHDYDDPDYGQYGTDEPYLSVELYVNPRKQTLSQECLDDNDILIKVNAKDWNGNEDGIEVNDFDWEYGEDPSNISEREEMIIERLIDGHRNEIIELLKDQEVYF